MIWELLQSDCEGETYYNGHIYNPEHLQLVLNSIY